MKFNLVEITDKLATLSQGKLTTKTRSILESGGTWG